METLGVLVQAMTNAKPLKYPQMRETLVYRMESLLMLRSATAASSTLALGYMYLDLAISDLYDSMTVMDEAWEGIGIVLRDAHEARLIANFSAVFTPTFESCPDLRNPQAVQLVVNHPNWIEVEKAICEFLNYVYFQPDLT
jgi:hypothetical protein